MLQKLCLFLFLLINFELINAIDEPIKNPIIEDPVETELPKYLYKIVTVESWEESRVSNHVQLTAFDHEFIHFAKEDQIERVVTKYWNHVPQFVVLTIDVKKLPGKMAFETNPGGSAKYYHLYNGSIPIEAVIEAKIVTLSSVVNK